MKAQIIVWVCILSGMMGTAQTVEKEGIEEALKTAVYEILKLSAQQDVDGLNTKYIHKEYGIYDVFRIGVGDLFKRRSNISFAFPPEGHVGTMYPNLIGVTKENIIKQLVVYDAKLDCGEIEWDREGFFITDNGIFFR